MPWHPSFATNLPEQDAQHRYFIALLDQLDVACQRDAGEAIEQMLEELERYAKYHFATEELLMTAYDYPSEAHRAEHRKLLTQLAEMRANPGYSRSRIRLFVFKWLTDHIQLVDRELAHYALERRRPYLEEIPADYFDDPDSAPLLTDAVELTSGRSSPR